jgi:hypothetical protein
MRHFGDGERAIDLRSVAGRTGPVERDLGVIDGDQSIAEDNTNRL